ncbi:MAG: hypothetical protein K6E20_06820, partial [Acholeplasmatales bacterium]|nr:hypothetical protein [Acholeplasmatales bacterium]
MKNKKLLFSFAIAFTSVVALTSCGGNKDKQSNTSYQMTSGFVHPSSEPTSEATSIEKSKVESDSEIDQSKVESDSEIEQSKVESESEESSSEEIKSFDEMVLEIEQSISEKDYNYIKTDFEIENLNTKEVTKDKYRYYKLNDSWDLYDINIDTPCNFEFNRCRFFFNNFIDVISEDAIDKTIKVLKNTNEYKIEYKDKEGDYFFSAIFGFDGYLKNYHFITIDTDEFYQFTYETKEEIVSKEQKQIYYDYIMNQKPRLVTANIYERYGNYEGSTQKKYQATFDGTWNAPNEHLLDFNYLNISTYFDLYNNRIEDYLEKGSISYNVNCFIYYYYDENNIQVYFRFYDGILEAYNMFIGDMPFACDIETSNYVPEKPTNEYYVSLKDKKASCEITYDKFYLYKRTDKQNEFEFLNSYTLTDDKWYDEAEGNIHPWGVFFDILDIIDPSLDSIVINVSENQNYYCVDFIELDKYRKTKLFYDKESFYLSELEYYLFDHSYNTITYENYRYLYHDQTTLETYKEQLKDKVVEEYNCISLVDDSSVIQNSYISIDGFYDFTTDFDYYQMSNFKDAINKITTYKYDYNLTSDDNSYILDYMNNIYVYDKDTLLLV